MPTVTSTHRAAYGRRPCVHGVPIRHSPLALLIAGAMLQSTVVVAQVQQTEQTELGAVVVESAVEDGTGPVAGQTNPVTRAGTKARTPLVEVPQSVTIVGAETLDDRNITRVSEALRYVPGVFTDVYGDDTDYDWHYIRGFQSDQSGVFWDDMQNLSYCSDLLVCSYGEGREINVTVTRAF